MFRNKAPWIRLLICLEAHRISQMVWASVSIVYVALETWHSKPPPGGSPPSTEALRCAHIRSLANTGLLYLTFVFRTSSRVSLSRPPLMSCVRHDETAFSYCLDQWNHSRSPVSRFVPQETTSCRLATRPTHTFLSRSLARLFLRNRVKIQLQTRDPPFVPWESSHAAFWCNISIE